MERLTSRLLPEHSIDWERFIDHLYEAHIDPLPTEYHYLTEKYETYGQEMKEMAYAEWFLLHKLPEVAREWKVDPWALLLVAVGGYGMRSPHVLINLFPSHSNHIERLSEQVRQLFNFLLNIPCVSNVCLMCVSDR